MASSICRFALPLRRPLRPPIRVPRASSRFQTPRSRSDPLYAFRRQIQTDANPQSTTKLKDDDSSSETWKIKMLYDGDCPLCMREVNMLKERNKSYGAIKFVDISSKDYSPEENEGLDYETVMGRIHAILSDGTVVRDVEPDRPPGSDEYTSLFLPWAAPNLTAVLPKSNDRGVGAQKSLEGI